MCPSQARDAFLLPLDLEVPSEGFHLWSPRHCWQGRSQGVRDRAVGATFPGTSPAVCIFGPLLEALWVQSFILPALWLLWWGDQFPETPHSSSPLLPGAVPTC